MKRIKLHKIKHVEFYLCQNCKIVMVTDENKECPRCHADIEWVELQK